VTQDDRNLERKFETAYFCGGCFWGIEYLYLDIPGIQEVQSGYMGGHITNPTYDDVCSTRSGHIEAVRIKFDPEKVSYETLTKRFFSMHDPSQSERQGPDIGSQYASVIFYDSVAQKITCEKLIMFLKVQKKINVVTKLIPAANHKFWVAEEYHQKHYEKTMMEPYCHFYEDKFVEKDV